MRSDQAPSGAATVAEPASTVPAIHGGGPAFGLGPRRAEFLTAAALVAAVLVVAFVGVLLNHDSGSAATHRLVGARGSATTRPVGQAPASAAAHGSAVTHGFTVARSARYGGLPSWLPKAKIPVGRVLQATSAHPALAIQGDVVSVHFASGRVLATAVGPTLPRRRGVSRCLRRPRARSSSPSPRRPAPSRSARPDSYSSTNCITSTTLG
jgi:hypothetical protein